MIYMIIYTTSQPQLCGTLKTYLQFVSVRFVQLYLFAGSGILEGGRGGGGVSIVY